MWAVSIARLLATWPLSVAHGSRTTGSVSAEGCSASWRIVFVAGTNRWPDAVVLARVQVAIEPREVAARDLQPQHVPLLEHVARGPHVDRELVDLARV